MGGAGRPKTDRPAAGATGGLGGPTWKSALQLIDMVLKAKPVYCTRSFE